MTCLPGCFSAGESVEETLDQAKQAILLHVDGMLDDDQPIPEATPMHLHRSKREFKGRIWALVEVCWA